MMSINREASAGFLAVVASILPIFKLGIRLLNRTSPNQLILSSVFNLSTTACVVLAFVFGRGGSHGAPFLAMAFIFTAVGFITDDSRLLALDTCLFVAVSTLIIALASLQASPKPKIAPSSHSQPTDRSEKGAKVQ